MAGTHDHLIEELESERESCLERVSAIDAAIEALTGTRPFLGDAYASLRNGARRRGSAGEDKIALIRDYIQARRGEHVRQAAIAKDLGLNSGTVSTATHELMLAGEIEKGPKRDRSITWTAVA